MQLKLIRHKNISNIYIYISTGEINVKQAL
jgi:hypothetical protein